METDASQPVATQDTDTFCPYCTYNLRHNQSQRCPECGHAIDRQRPCFSRLAWERRRHLGRARCYLATALSAMYRPARLAREVEYPVSFSDGRCFRAVTVLLASSAVLLVGLLPRWTWQLRRGTDPIARMQTVIEDWLLDSSGRGTTALAPLTLGLDPTVLLACAALFLLLASGISSYFFHPRRLAITGQNRAIAISQYACAAWVWLVPAALLWALSISTSFGAWPIWLLTVVGKLYFVAAALVVAAVVLWWIDSIVIFKISTSAPIGTALVFAAGWPMLMGMLAVYCFVGIPWAVGFVRMVVFSLR